MSPARKAACKFNPLIGSNSGETCSQVAAVLDVFGNVNYAEAGTEIGIGLLLLSQTAATALRFEAGED